MKTFLLLSLVASILVQTGLSQDTPAEEISLSAELTASDLAFEETTDLKIIVKWRGMRTKYAFEAFPLPETENLQVQGTSSSVSSGSDDLGRYVIRKFTYTLKPTNGGVGAIEPISLKYFSMPDSIPGELTTQRFQVAIAAPKAVEHPEGTSSSSLYIIYGALGAVVIVAVIVLFMKRKSGGEEEPERTPEEKVVEEIGHIKKEFGTDRKQFFSRLYKTLIGYIEEKYDINTAGRTTKIVCDELGKLEIEIDHKVKLTGWLNLADKEKYAPMTGEPGDIIRLATDLDNYFRSMKNSPK